MTESTGLPWWDDPLPLWDTVQLAGFVFPGIVNIGGGVERDIDVKKAKGEDGATLKDNGYKPSQIDIELRISTEEEWLELQDLLPEIHPRAKGGERTAIGIYHPATDLLGVKSMYVKKIDFPFVNGEKQIVLRISGFEWQQKPKPVKKGAGGGGSGGGGGGGSGNGNVDDELKDDETDQYILDEEESDLEEARRKWAEEDGPFGDEWPMDEDEQKEFMQEYYDGYDGNEQGGDSSGLGDDGEENIEDLSDYNDEYGWT